MGGLAFGEPPVSGQGGVLPAHAVLFDLDGTLLDSGWAYYRVACRACEVLGWPIPDPSLIRQVMGFGRSILSVVLGGDEKVTPAHREAFGRAMAAVWDEVFMQEVRLFEDALSTLGTLHQLGFRLGLVTDAQRGVAAALLNAPGLAPLDAAVTREDVREPKPSPLPLLAALARMGLAPEAAVYAGDTPKDVQAARAAGMRAVAVLAGSPDPEGLRAAGPDLAVERLADLPARLRWSPPVVEGRVLSGSGEAASFMGLPWVQARLAALLGGPPYPGTLNLECSPEAAAVVGRMRQDPRVLRAAVAPEPGYCPALCHPVEVEPRRPGVPTVPALLLWPQVDGYPPTKLELVSRARLREAWSLQDGDPVIVRYLAGGGGG